MRPIKLAGREIPARREPLSEKWTIKYSPWMPMYHYDGGVTVSHSDGTVRDVTALLGRIRHRERHNIRLGLRLLKYWLGRKWRALKKVANA